MRQHFASLLLVPLLLLAEICPAQSQQVFFNKIVSPFGSSFSGVRGIAQDKNGFMWFATGSGLYRYDGYRFKNYVNDPSENSISTSNLETVYVDLEGNIWVATWIEGINRLDPITGIWTRFRHDADDPSTLSNDTVRSFLSDRDGNLWIGTNGGLDKYDPKTQKFQNFHYGISCKRVRKIYQDTEGTIWVGTGSVWDGEGGETNEGGLNRFDKKTGRFTSYQHNPNDPHSLINNKIQAICEDSRGVFWVGTAGDGLHTMNRATGEFERHLYDPAHHEKLSRPPLKTAQGPDHITFITEDSAGHIWIGTLGNGISYYDPKTGKMVHYTSQSSSSGFTDNSGWSFCISRDDILWIGTFQGGLYNIDPYHKNIPHISIGYSVTGFRDGPLNSLWIGTSEGLILRNKATGVSRNFVHNDLNPTSISDDIIRSMYQDPEGPLWIGTGNGINRFNAQLNNFTRFQNDPKEINSIRAGSIWAIEDGGGDSLWIGTSNGLDLMNKRTGRVTRFTNNPKDRNSLSPNAVTSLARDKSGNLWVGTWILGGLYYLDRKTGTFKHFLKGKSIGLLHLDADGILWVGTDGEGVYTTNNSGENFTKISSVREYTSVASILEDGQKNIWISTFNNGIYKIDRRTNQSAFFNEKNGINTSNLNFKAGYVSTDGEIYLGDNSGYYLFSSREKVNNSVAPQIALTDFRINGKPVIPGKGSPLRSPLEIVKSISLNYRQNTIAFDFAGIHYSNPENNQHFYMLENYDADWRRAESEKTAYYFNLPPGRYVFKVRAASNEGVWAERPVDIIIAPPWWRTLWAYVIYGLLFLILAFSIHRYQKTRLLKAERERTRVKELAQAKEIEKAYHELRTTQSQLIQQEKMASLGELTAGIAHEIQNPLNFINNFSEVNTELVDELKSELATGNTQSARGIADNIKDNEQKINHHGKRADAIVKGMLQHSKTSSGQKELTDINSLADEYLRLAYHGLRAKDKSFNADFKTDFDDSIGKINIIPQDIGRVILNLINNAFYAVDEKKKGNQNGYEPTVLVSTKKEKDKVEIKVKDNGNGIPQKVLDKIFQPFFTTKPPGQGTGLGLSLAYDIITKGHGGELKVETKEGEGSEFSIQLPVSKIREA